MFRQDYARLSIFSGLDGIQIDQLSPYLTDCRFHASQTIFHQGQPAEHLYILVRGKVVITYKPYDGPPLTVAHITPGGVFGWSSALHREIYTSSAAADEESWAIRIRGDSLPVICMQFPETGKILLERLASVIAERLRSTHTQVLGILSQGIDAEGSCSRRNDHDI